MKNFGFLVSAATLATFVGLAAAPHHSGAIYFESAKLEHKNVSVVSYILVNPHGRLVYAFTDDAGNKVEWTAELQSANYSRRMGVDPSTFSPGQTLTSVSGAPSRSGSKFIRLDRVVFENGDVAQLTGAERGIIRAGAK
jgi:Family of unknown function (DUF6152)